MPRNKEKAALYQHKYYQKHKKEKNATKKKQRNKNPWKDREYSQKANLKDWRVRAISNARKRSVKKKIPFGITLEDISTSMLCECCGKKTSVEVDQRHPDKVNLDRVVPNLGYVKNNIAILCCRCNAVKGNASVEELLMVVDFLKRKQPVAISS